MYKPYEPNKLFLLQTLSEKIDKIKLYQTGIDEISARVYGKLEKLYCKEQIDFAVDFIKNNGNGGGQLKNQELFLEGLNQYKNPNDLNIKDQNYAMVTDKGVIMIVYLGIAFTKQQIWINKCYNFLGKVKNWQNKIPFMSLTCVVPADEFDSSLYQEMIEKFEKVIPNYYFVKE